MMYNKIISLVCLLALASCKVISERVPCSYNFTDNIVDIWCQAEHDLLGFNCTWIYQMPNKRTWWQSLPSVDHKDKKNLTTCTASIVEPEVGAHTVILTIESKTRASDKLNGHVKYTIEAPRNPARFTASSGVMKASQIFLEDGVVIKLECHQNEGTPRVYKISIICDMYKQNERYRQGYQSIWIKVKPLWDQTSCICYTHHISSPNAFSTELNISVISPPEQLTCTSTILDATTAQVTCNTTRVYPKAECKVQLGHPTSSQIVTHPPKHQNATEPGYFTTTCWASFLLTNHLNYVVDVEMYPYVHNYNTYNTSALKSTRAELTLELPKTPPKFTMLKGHIIGEEFIVSDDGNVTVNCSVTGGKPPVLQTHIQCDWKQYTNNGSSAQFSIRVNKTMHRKVCICSASHVTKNYSLTSRFILNVQIPAVIDILLFHPRPGCLTNEYTPGTQLTLWCNVTANPKPKIDFSYKKEVIKLKRFPYTTTDTAIRHFLIYSMIATCNNTGVYSCSVSNQLKTNGSSREVELKVTCRVEHCNKSNDVPSFGVAIGEVVNISLCVIAYQTPIEFTLYGGNNLKEINKTNYGAMLTTTADEKLSRGVIHVTMSNVTVSDIGNFSLRLTLPKHGPVKYSTLNFSLYAKGPPLCPSNLSLDIQSEDHAVLNWIPGFDGGLAQTFVISLITQNCSTTSPSRCDHVDVGSVPQIHADKITYNLTGLTQWTPTQVYVQPKNAEGNRECPEVKILLTKSGSRGVFFSEIIVLAVSFPQIALLMALFIRWLRKPKKKSPSDDARKSDRPLQGIYNSLADLNSSKTAQGSSKTNKFNVKSRFSNQVEVSQCGRTVSPEGLIYLSVEVDPNERKKAEVHPLHAALPQQRTEYMTLDLAATSKC